MQRIMMADIIRCLNSGPGMIVGISRESGIGMYKLNKWKDGNGEPAGDEMLKLVDAVSVLSGNQNEQENYSSPPGRYWTDMIRKLETENDDLRQTIHDLKVDLERLRTGKSNSMEILSKAGNR